MPENHDRYTFFGDGMPQTKKAQTQFQMFRMQPYDHIFFFRMCYSPHKMIPNCVEKSFLYRNIVIILCTKNVSIKPQFELKKSLITHYTRTKCYYVQKISIETFELSPIEFLNKKSNELIFHSAFDIDENFIPFLLFVVVTLVTQ